MSRRLAADKRSNGQTLQSLENYVHVRDPKEAGGPKGKARGSRHPEDEGSPLARGSPSPTRSPQHNTHFFPRPEKNDFRKSLQKNVFIDSYYPVVQADCSETSGNSHSSYEEIYKHGTSVDGQKTEGCWETDSEEAYKNILISNINSVDPLPPNRSLNSSTTLTTACPTLDSRTYTVLSCSSDFDSTFVNISQPPKEESSKNTIPDDDHYVPSAVSCFTQLYHRIHNLEDLLQQTTVQSVQPKGSKCTEAAGDEEEKPKPVKKKFSRVKNPATGVANPWESTCPPIPEVTCEKANSDTDNELRNIKKRLRVLERKLRRTKQPSPPSFSLHRYQRRNPHKLLTSSSPVFTGTGGRSCGRSRDTDSTVPLPSETESFLQSKVLLLSSGSYEKSEGDSCDKKVKTKARKKFVSKCRGIRRKYSGMVSSGKKISNKNDSLKVSTTSGWSEVLYKHSIVTEESVATNLLSQAFSTHTKTDSSTVFYCRLRPPKGLLESPRIPRKKNGKKRKYLCKKNSKTNMLSVHCTHTPEKELMLTTMPTTNAFVFGDCDLPPAKTLQICKSNKDARRTVSDKNIWTGIPWKGNPVGDSPTWELHSPWIPFRNKCCPPSDHRCEQLHQEDPNCTLKVAQPPKKRISLRNPLDVLKRGGKLKIPVLFEEVCKTPDSKKPGHKLSNVSMRFVVVEEDNGHPLMPLRKLIKKLSQAKPPHKKEHFVFGVSRCRCEGQVGRACAVLQ